MGVQSAPLTTADAQATAQPDASAAVPSVPTEPMHDAQSAPQGQESTWKHASTSSPSAGGNTEQAPAGGSPTVAAAPQWKEGVGRAEAFPALSSMHFSADGSAAAAMVGDQGFDAAAYAAYQDLFDVPGGRYPPPFAAQREAAAAGSMTEVDPPAQQHARENRTPSGECPNPAAP